MSVLPSPWYPLLFFFLEPIKISLTFAQKIYPFIGNIMISNFESFENALKTSKILHAPCNYYHGKKVPQLIETHTALLHKNTQCCGSLCTWKANTCRSTEGRDRCCVGLNEGVAPLAQDMNIDSRKTHWRKNLKKKALVMEGRVQSTSMSGGSQGGSISKFEKGMKFGRLP